MVPQPPATARRPRVLIASCRAVLDGALAAPDDAALLPALVDRGVDARAAAWDDPSVDWAAADLVVIRSTWDYHHARDAFVAWCEQVERSSALANPAAVVRTNTDKRYLSDLAAAGVPTVPTRVVAPGDPAELPAELAGQELVVKPAVSAGAEDTGRYPPAARADAAAHVRRLTRAGRAALVQPYQHRVDAAGETAVVFLDGRFSHALRKAPRLLAGTGGQPPAPERLTSHAPSAAERDAAARALSAAGAGGLLYARVDLVGGDDGPRLLELELTEPQLFLDRADAAVDQLADAIVARCPPAAHAAG